MKYLNENICLGWIIFENIFLYEHILKENSKPNLISI